MPPPVLRLCDVEKRFAGNVTAVEALSFAVGAGEFLTLLGPSGCGKSTILRLIAGLAEPSRGRIEWTNGRGAGDLGMVFQDATLMPWATVARNVWLPLRLRGISLGAASAQVGEALNRVGLADFAGAYPRELSGGMKMRVAIARAMVTRPRVILMDEPFAALDEITRFRLNDDLLRLKQDIGCTIVFVTHSVFESVFLSDRILVMSPRPGRIVQDMRIDAGTARNAEFRTSARYAGLCRDVSVALRDAMGVAA